MERVERVEREQEQKPCINYCYIYMRKNIGLTYPDLEVPISRRSPSLKPPSYDFPSHDPLGGYPLEAPSLSGPTYDPPRFVYPSDRFETKDVSK